jgi:SOS-response transcriptional repressor LexA
MDVFDTRRARLQVLVEQLANGNISDFAKKFGYSRAQVSQYLSEKYNDGRSIGERAARTLELNVGKGIGWLDQPMNSVDDLVARRNMDSSVIRGIVAASNELEPNKRRYNIPVLGTVTPTSDGLIGAVVGVPDRAIPHILFYTLSTRSWAIQVKGSHLQPRIRSGEYLLLDGEKKAEPGDDLIVKFTNGEWMILQLLYSRNDEIVFGNVNGSGSSSVVPEYDITSMTPIVATLSGQMKIIVVEPKEIS